MEGETRKRKIESTEERKKDEEDNEEEKMEKFFALIRSTKEMRDKIKRGSNDQSKEKEGKMSAIWNPSFEPEDFLQDAQGSEAAGSSKKQEDEKKPDDREGGNDIDLNLSL